MFNDSESGLNAVDALNLLALFLLSVLAAFFHRELGAEAFWLVGVFGALTIFVLAAARLSLWRPSWRGVHDFSPVLLVPVLFNTLGGLIDCASPLRWDSTFNQLDAQLFGDFPRIWRGVLGRPSWMVDVASAAYIAYYLVPVVLAIVLYQRGTRADFQQLVFTVALTFYASYAAYFIFPTVGPRVPAAESLLVGGGVSRAVRAFVQFTERTRTDAFPSGHAAVALVCLSFAWQISGRVFSACAPIVAGILFSTVYLHYHYVVDVVAGVVLAAGCLWLGPRLEPLLEPRQMRRWLAVHMGIR